MTPEQQAVAAANQGFYDALNARDLAAMERIWFPADWAECIHPGGIALRGWPAVRDSWAIAFMSTVPSMVAVTDVHVHLLGDVAWVSCTERIAATIDGEIHASAAHATNVFVRHDDAWRMVVHHASPVPYVVPAAPEGGLLVN